MKIITYVIATLFSTALAFYSFLVFMASFSGHPPSYLLSILGVSILPISLLCTAIFSPIALLYFVAIFERRWNSSIQVRQILRKIHIINISFVATVVIFSILMAGSLVIPLPGSWSTSMKIVSYIIFICLSLCSGYWIYNFVADKLYGLKK